MRIIAKACVAGIVWFGLAASAFAQGIQWQQDLETAKKAAAASNRLVLMHFSASWCHWCKPLEKNVFDKPQVIAALDASYVAVRMDYDQHRQIAKQYGVRGVPWDVVITPDGYWVEDFNSPQTAEQYAARVTKVATREAAKLNAQYAAQQPAVQPAPAPGLPVAPAAVDTRSFATQQPQAVATPSSPAVRKPADDRYADYYASRQQQAAPRVDAVQPPYAGQVTPPADAHTFNAPPAQNPGPAAPPSVPGQPLNPPNMTSVAPGGPAFGSPGSSPSLGSNVPMAQPTFAMDGHCPVHLLEQGAWVPGDRRWGATHRGKTYLFVGEGCQKKFLADPDRYAPALSGNDPVALVDRGTSLPGRREHGCYFGVEPNRRIVLFADEASFQTFKSNPQRYAGQIFAAQ